MLLCALVQLAHAGDITRPGQFLDQAEHLRTSDHARFVQMLAQIHREAPPLTPDQQWHLRYLDAWEAMYEGDYTGSAAEFRAVAAHSGMPVLATKAEALLLSNLGINGHYQEAYELANRLVRSLPQVTDAEARFTLLDYLSQAMRSAGQNDLAIRYARMMQASTPAGEAPCKASALLVSALDSDGRLTLSSPELVQGLTLCERERQPLFVVSLRYIEGDLLLKSGQSRKALAVFDGLATEVRQSGYRPQLLWLQAYRALALARLGDDATASKAALDVLVMAHPDDKSWPVMEANYQLYQIEKKLGHAAEALKYRERYASLEQASANGVSARAIAYEAVQQHVLAQQLETEHLVQQNAALRMRQQLAAKTAEANRLYIALLLAVLAFGTLAMFRLKRSQLRFRRLSRLDGLTAVLNRQSFMQDAEGVLRRLQRESGAACMVYMDLDHFKRINDTHGHAVGDAVLRQVVATCRQHLRAVDLFGRLGGEEFGLLLVDCAREQALLIANRIRRAVEATATAHAQITVTATVSLGLAFGDTSGWDVAALCRDADAALYQAKREGRNQVVGGFPGVG